MPIIYDSAMITVICPDCGTPREITSTHARRNTSHRCKICGVHSAGLISGARSKITSDLILTSDPDFGPVITLCTVTHANEGTRCTPKAMYQCPHYPHCLDTITQQRANWKGWALADSDPMESNREKWFLFKKEEQILGQTCISKETYAKGLERLTKKLGIRSHANTRS